MTIKTFYFPANHPAILTEKYQMDTEHDDCWKIIDKYVKDGQSFCLSAERFYTDNRTDLLDIFGNPVKKYDHYIVHLTTGI
jgi:hypothetical protein